MTGSAQRQYYFYIMTNSTNVAVYTGMTNDLKRRVFQHREKMVEGFTKRYDQDILSCHPEPPEAEKGLPRMTEGGQRAVQIDKGGR
ncbi:MAG: GIY-YIG nuclease family protein [Chloroflexi bacterium]|nr:GIY-YIG nuclease family protein [Chloroflexota bacterium]